MNIPMSAGVLSEIEGHLFLRDDEFLRVGRRDIALLVEEIRRLTDIPKVFLPEDMSHFTLSDKILLCMRVIGRPTRAGEIRALLAARNSDQILQGINGQLCRMAKQGIIRRVKLGLYETRE